MERLVKKIKWSDINPEYKNLNLDDFYMVNDVSFENLLEIQKILEKLYNYEDLQEKIGLSLRQMKELFDVNKQKDGVEYTTEKQIKEEILKKYIKCNYDTVELATQGYGFDVYSVEFSNDIIGGLINNDEKRIIYIDDNIFFYCKKRMILCLLIDYLLNAKSYSLYAKSYSKNIEINKRIKKIAEDILEKNN